MKMPQVIEDLHRRIEQSQSWLKAGPSPLTGLKFRTEKPWTAMPVTFLDDAKRVEQYGVGFVLSADAAVPKITAQVNVRIKPDLTAGAEVNETPYVIVYVVDQTTGADETIKWFHIEIPASYEELTSLPIDEWYRYWISRALERGKSGKILRSEMRLSE